MAQPTNTHDAYDVNTNREQIHDVITNIDSVDCPVMSRIGKGGKSTAAYKEWTLDGLAAAADNAHIDGDDFSGEALTDAVKLGNHHQIMRKDLTVTRRANIIDKAGKKSETAYQIAKAAKEIKRDQERAITKRKVAVVGSSSVAPQLAGIPAWIRANDQLGVGGSSPTLSGTTQGYPNGAGTVGTARALSEATLLAAQQGGWESGGDPSLVVVSPTMKSGMSAFLFSSDSRVATQYQDQGKSPKGGATVVSTVDYYVSDFGTLEVVADRFSPSGATASEVMILDPDLWELSFLDGYHVEEIAKSGDSEKRMLVVDFTLCSKAEAGSAVVAAVNDTTAMVA